LTAVTGPVPDFWLGRVVAGDFGVSSRRAARFFSSLRMAACHPVADGLGNPDHEDADRDGAEPDHFGSLPGTQFGAPASASCRWPDAKFSE